MVFRAMDNYTEIRTIIKLNKYKASGNFPADTSIVKLLGIHYVHLTTEDGGDLYVTKYGLPYVENLKPENWYEKDWFKEHRERLNGTSTVYKVPTKPVNNKNLNLVVKWSRVGQDVPLETRVLEAVLSAEFNSPFEEFALVEELRLGNYGPDELRLLTHKPLSIYVPPERLQLWQTGRSKYKINMKVRKHPGVEIDILRQYILMYEWIEGVDAAEAYEQLKIPQTELHKLSHTVIEEMWKKGFWVADMKPAHIIVRKQNDGRIVHRRNKIIYALIDFELLQRTPAHEEEIVTAKRADYLIRQRDRFKTTLNDQLPPYLKQVNILGVDYICGRVESTGGALWVVGKDPNLFDYFQPERWRKTHQIKLSESHHVYYTQTKDNINLVWKTSRVGEIPEVDPQDAQSRRIIEYGYNSPFEEFSFALELNQRGIPTTYPRAIYMTGPQSELPPDSIADKRRYETHKDLLTPEGRPILRPDHDYIKIWGYWNGPDELLATDTVAHYHGISAVQAFRNGLLSEQELQELIERVQGLLSQAAFEALNLTHHHLLLSADPSGALIRDEDGLLEVRLCNFELVKRI